jgi:superfamily II DNA or RNA helicase
MHSELSASERRNVFESFSNGTVEAIVAPRLLDEGIDVPEADFAVILASSRTQRQMIQRMGRIIRPKSDGRVARFAITYILDTSEDPALGAHEAFLGEIIDVADDSTNFTSASTVQELTAFLSP